MKRIAIVGLGYVGLPLAVKFAHKYPVLGYDISVSRVNELKQGKDSSEEVSESELSQATITYTTQASQLKKADYIIMAIPTPVLDDKRPDLRPLLLGCKDVGKHLKKGSIIVFESTVYPGCTERDCIPVLEKYSGMKEGKDFHVAYSPERINPGKKKLDLEKLNTTGKKISSTGLHGGPSVDKIVKVVGANDEKVLHLVGDLYESVISAGTHRVPSIKVAEAAKVIENCQRDINIAFVNELKMIFDKMGIDVYQVLEAANTKWNFLPFYPGLVGGHCIGVDPYYLAAEAKRVGHEPQIILAGRGVNDNMAIYEASQIVKDIATKGLNFQETSILVLGGSFKPNVPDMRNSKIEDLVKHLLSFGLTVHVCEPMHLEKTLFGVPNVDLNQIEQYTYVVKGVKHDMFKRIDVDYTLL